MSLASMSNAVQQLWLEIVDAAAETPADRLEQLATETAADCGASKNTIYKRLLAAKWHLDEGMLPEALCELGMERAVSDWQKACNAATGKPKGSTVLWQRRVSQDLKEKLNEMLRVVRAAVGCNEDMALEFICDLVIGSEPEEIQHLFRQQHGGE